jgi:DNA repair exonuclease SbcCD ATPase subunit
LIILQTLELKNFLSYGNAVTKLKLNEYRNTLIASASGTGKSAIVDAVCYALFGKPYRPIKLGQLINSVNQKGLETSLEFSIGSNSYRVVRGMRPAIFEIYENGKLQAQEAATRDYQAFLENSIIKISYKTFCQISAIGTAGFTPFMQLTTGQRRDVIEDVLDIAIFSKMNSILKVRVIENRDGIVRINHLLDSVKKDTENQKKIIAIMDEHHSEKIASLQSSITASRGVIGNISDDIEQKRALLEIKRKSIQPSVQDYSRDIFLLEDEHSRLDKKSSEVDSLDTCPTCLQSVDDNHKHLTRNEAKQRLDSITSELVTIKELQIMYSEIEDSNLKISQSGKNIRAEIAVLESKLNSTSSDISNLTEQISDLNSNRGDIDTERTKLKSGAANALRLLNQKKSMIEERAIQEVIIGLLKDSGIKSAIIKEYVPILNRLINRYLSEFGFFIDFTLDEAFDEKILSRGRDEFTYNSFSEGEKTKIDLSILFAFRQITELKNSANCNLLVIDEVGDSHLDLNSKESFMSILSSMENGNNFIISHNAPDVSLYDQVIKIEKRGDFSVLEIQ